MNEIKNQPEALRLADIVERLNVGVHSQAIAEEYSAAARELRRLHAENQDLRTRHYCNAAEIESLQARVQELGEMARENRSKRVIELEQRIAELESEAEQNTKIIGASAETELALRGRVEELERKLASIGAGGVGQLRSPKASVKHSDAIVFANDRPDGGSERLMEWAIDAEDLIRSQHAMIFELNDQLAAIGAGGVEPLRKRAEAAPQAVQAAVPETREALAKRLIADVQVADTIATSACQRVAELPDRDSPADWPEAMLVTGDELHMIVREAVIEAQTAPAHPAEEVPALTEKALAEKIRSHGGYGGLAAHLIPFIAQHAAPKAQAVQAAVPLPLLVRDIARDLGITVPQACIALKPLGNYSTNSAVTAEMARMLRDHFPAPAHPAEGVPAQKVHPFGWFITKSKLSGDTEFTQDPVRENLARSFGYQTKALYDHPTQQGLEQFIERVGDVHFQRCRVGSKEGETRWDIEFGNYGAEVRGKTLREAITKAIAAQAKQGEQANG